MGWWESLWPSDNQDPLRKLDPKLKEFLEKESPIKYQQAQSSVQTEPQAKSRTSPVTPTSEPDSKPAVPAESQFQDGRYADLWKGYKSLGEVEAESKSEHEKLMDVLDGYKERKAQIGKAALENCAMEQFDWRACMANPSLMERMTLCRTQVKKFEKCYTTQTKLLKALGYLSTYDRTPEVEEEIQLHADTLYHRLMKQEAEIEEAKNAGKPIPKFDSIVPKKPLQGASKDDELTPEQQKTLQEKLEKLPEEERAAEEQAIRADIRVRNEMASRVKGIWKQQEHDRQVRKEVGEATTWDKLVGTFKGDGNSKK